MHSRLCILDRVLIYFHSASIFLLLLKIWTVKFLKRGGMSEGGCKKPWMLMEGVNIYIYILKEGGVVEEGGSRTISRIYS